MASLIVGGTVAAGTLRLGNGIIKTVGSNESWRETSGRESGAEGYKFGDMTKSVWNSFWGSDTQGGVAIATPLDSGEEQLSHLQTELLKIQGDIDKYEEDEGGEENNEIILTYLKNKKKQIKQKIKIIS
tara:strand:- start:916 stop:1302 length:387 start_codon:yes stop_codon:yes gene_type:complete